MGDHFQEVLHWYPADSPPDADTTMLLWFVVDGLADWAVGWWNGEYWMDAATGGKLSGQVLYWVDVNGPGARHE
jgi:hypothetical protein